MSRIDSETPAGPGHLKLTRRAAAAAALAALALPGQVQTSVAQSNPPPQSNVGRVTAKRGSAFAEAGTETRNLSEAGPVYLDEVLRTENESRVAILLGEKTRVRLGANAKLRIDQFVINSGGKLELGSGALEIDAAPNSSPRGLTVASPFALIAVRGTRFFAGTEPDGRFGVFVDEGAVSVSASGKTVTVSTGMGTTIAKAGEAPSDPAAWGAPRIERARRMVG